MNRALRLLQVAASRPQRSKILPSQAQRLPKSTWSAATPLAKSDAESSFEATSSQSSFILLAAARSLRTGRGPEVQPVRADFGHDAMGELDLVPALGTNAGAHLFDVGVIKRRV